MSNLAAATPAATNSIPAPTMRDYAEVGLILLLHAGILTLLVRSAARSQPAPEALLQPLYGMVALVGVVWLLTAVIRNYAAVRGLISMEYFRDYSSLPPPEWLERSARTFNNLMQVPTLFYVVTLLMLHTGRFDAAQVTLAWAFVAIRALHAAVYICWNTIRYRFASWMASTITLAVLWFRFV